MDSISSDDNMEGIEDESSGQLYSPCCTDGSENFGDTVLAPSVGDQYQAEIPPLVAGGSHFPLKNRPAFSDIASHDQNPFLLGLPIPVMLVTSEVENRNVNVNVNGDGDGNGNGNGNLQDDNSAVCQITSSNVDPETTLKALGGCSETKGASGSELMDVSRVSSHQSNSRLNQLDRYLCLVPGTLGESWKDVERDSFLLGLYIFGKNLLLVKRFVESKGMGDILSFYYGKFYKSDEYNRWSELRKLKSRRSIHGQKIFTGWRQHELLSRIFPHVSDECRTALLELCRAFGEGKVSFEDTVFTLKSTVGINILIEAVSIGKGKQDLTGIAADPVKTNPVFSVQPEIPTGKACSSLTPADIIKYLTGGYRLSKTRSNDLFWEAVWPRLLARGWHSEQPNYKDHVISGSKTSLVYIIPGIRKFSRRRLVKGNDYFDSITDVLNKVASEPGLLELETEKTEETENKDESNPSRNEDNLDHSSTLKQCHYLQPHKSKRSRNLRKFTIVDTSMVEGTERGKLRELRSLPFELSASTTPSSLSSESEQDDTSEDSDVKSEEDNTSSATCDTTEREACVVGSSDCVNSSLNIGTINEFNPTSLIVEDNESHSNKKPQMKSMKYQSGQNGKLDGHSKSTKYQFGQNGNPDCLKYLTPVTKHPVLTVCNNEESSRSCEYTSTTSKDTEDRCHWMSNSPGDTDFRIGPSQNLSQTTSLPKCIPDGSNEYPGKDVSPEKRQPNSLIDLNIPQVSPGNDEHVVTNVAPNSETSCANKTSLVQPEISLQVEPLNLLDNVDQHSINNQRRSKRDRSLTTKALEAFAYGFLSPKKKRKSSEASRNCSMPRSTSRKVQGNTSITDALRNGSDSISSNSKETSFNGICEKTDMVDES